jgi:hypothetical protein
MSGTSGSVRAILYALAANVGIFLAKAAAAVATGSGAMLAEGVHFAGRLRQPGPAAAGHEAGEAPPTPDFPLGYGKEVYFWSFLVALMLFSVGGAFSVYEGIHKLLEPEPIERRSSASACAPSAWRWSGGACEPACRKVNKTRGAQSLWRWFRDSRDSEMIVVFGEQLARCSACRRAVRGRDHADDRRSDLRRLGTAGDRRAADRTSSVFRGDRGQGAADRPERGAGKARGDPRLPAGAAGSAEIYNVITLQMDPDVMVGDQASLAKDLARRSWSRRINTVELALRAQFPDVRWSFYRARRTAIREPDLPSAGRSARSPGRTRAPPLVAAPPAASVGVAR